MPYLDPKDASNRQADSFAAVKERRGSPPWREPLLATPSFRQVLLYWAPGERTVRHWHPRAAESFIVLEGRGTFIFDGSPPVPVQPGSCLFASPGTSHIIEVTGTEPMLLLATVSPNEPDDTVEEPA